MPICNALRRRSRAYTPTSTIAYRALSGKRPSRFLRDPVERYSYGVKRDHESILDDVARLMAKVGAYQLSEWRRRPPGWGSEKSSREWVSHVDLRSQDLLRDGLSRIVPEAAFIGEEGSPPSGGGAEAADLSWIVDPLDGTSNYLSGLDWFNVSVALVDEEGPLLSCVYRPPSGERYSAIRSRGACYQGTPLPPAGKVSLRDSLVATGTPYRSPDLAAPFFEAAAALLPKCRDLRRLGSAALDLCEVASGRIQAFWEPDLAAWDVAAALLVLLETGCPVYDISGSPYSFGQSRIIVTGWHGAAEALLSTIAPFYGADPNLTVNAIQGT
jgi:myo-inositol-1(or 4)-monophosphatase